jgi:hypothetical protein
MKTPTNTLADALDILARDIESGDGVANAAIAEAAQRLREYMKSSECMLIEDNKRMRKAGCKLAEAAMRVCREYDGIHRLSLAISEWSKAIADEGGRGKKEIK